MLDFLFNRNARPKIPQTHLMERDVLFILGCRALEGETETEGFGDPDSGPYASYTFRNSLDGRTFELLISSRQPDGEIYSSYVSAERLRDASPLEIQAGRRVNHVLDIKAIVFDNQPETLRSAKEIYDVLNWLGNQVRWISRGHLPAIHEEKGRFSALGRWLTRIMPKPGGDGLS